MNFSNVVKLIKKYVLYGIFSVLIVLFVWDYIGRTHSITGSSMEPTLHDGDFVITEKLTKDFNVNDIVVIKINEKFIIKRIIAIEGDTVEITDGKLIVNGDQVQSSFSNESFFKDFPQTVIEEGKFFALGDNYNNSSDSRKYGTFYFSQIEGKLFLRLMDEFERY